MDPAFLAQLVLNGIVIGVIYALIAMGLSLIFGVLEIVNFAHGEFYMLGAMLAYFLTVNLELGYWPIIVVVTVVALAVEDEAMARRAERVGFDLAQGFHFVRPERPSRIDELLAAS